MRITEFLENEEFFEARAEYLTEIPGDVTTTEALLRTVGDEFERYAKVRKNIPEEALAAVGRDHRACQAGRSGGGASGHRGGAEAGTAGNAVVSERLEKVYGLMQGEMSVLQVEKKIKTRVKSQMEKTQREYYLNEQMKAIQKELGDGEDGKNEVAELEAEDRRDQAVQRGARKGRRRAEKAQEHVPMSAEATVVRNYLDWILSIPWGTKSRVKKDLGRRRNHPG